jgi:hypothetical protein
MHVSAGNPFIVSRPQKAEEQYFDLGANRLQFPGCRKQNLLRITIVVGVVQGPMLGSAPDLPKRCACLSRHKYV